MVDRRFSIFGNRRRLEEARAEADRLQERLRQERMMEEERRMRERHLNDQVEQMQRQLQQVQTARDQQEVERQDRRRIDQERRRHEELQRERERRRHEEKLERMRQMSPETLRNLRELIRQKYELDVEIWDLRAVRKPDRWIVIEKMEKADAVLQEILTMVTAWEGTQQSWTGGEWERVQEIQDRLQVDNKRWWTGNPPWEDD